MPILGSTSTWRIATAAVLTIASSLLLSQVIAGDKTRSSSNPKTSVKQASPTRVDGIMAATPASGTIDANNQSVTYTDGPTAPNALVKSKSGTALPTQH
jgi:hypothetical protein